MGFHGNQLIFLERTHKMQCLGGVKNNIWRQIPQVTHILLRKSGSRPLYIEETDCFQKFPACSVSASSGDAIFGCSQEFWQNLPRKSRFHAIRAKCSINSQSRVGSGHSALNQPFGQLRIGLRGRAFAGCNWCTGVAGKARIQINGQFAQ